MSLPPIPAEILTKPDEAAGVDLLAWWIGFQLEKRGVALVPGQPIPKLLAQECVRATQKLEADEIGRMPLAKALSLAARGEFERAGKVLRQIIGEGGQELHKQRLAEIGTRARARGRRASRQLNDSRRQDADAKQKRWLSVGEPLRKKHPDRSNSWLADQIAAKTHDKASSIRAAIPRLGLGRVK